MRALRSLALAVTCFTRLPAPHVEWDRDNLRYVLAWLPAIGAVVGALAAAWCLACDALGFGAALRAAGVALVPVAVTGGIHLDGFADVADARASHAEPARKRQIMADPHIGAFAAMGVAAYLVAYFALATELPGGWRAAALVACLHVMSRSCSAFASAVFPGSTGEGMLAGFREGGKGGAAVAAAVACYAAAVAASLALCPAAGCAMGAAGALSLVWVRGFAQRGFGGMSGDVAGFYLQVCELVFLACIVVAAKAAGI